MSNPLLHTVNQSPFHRNTLAECLHCYREGDAILLLENGVYGALASQPLAEPLGGKTCYAIRADLEARGLLALPLIEGISLIDYDEFVGLTVTYPVVNSWY